MSNETPTLKDQVKDNPGHWPLRLLAAGEVLEQEGSEAAADLVLEAPAPPATEEDLAKAYEFCMTDRAAGALGIAQSFLESHPDSATAHMICAQLSWLLEDRGKTGEHYQKAIGLNPDYKDDELEAWLSVAPEDAAAPHPHAIHAAGETEEAPEVAVVSPPIPEPDAPPPPVVATATDADADADAAPAPAIPKPVVDIPVPDPPVSKPADEEPPPVTLDPATAVEDDEEEIAPVTPVPLSRTPPPPLEVHHADPVEEIQKEALEATGLVTASPFTSLEILKVDSRPKDTKEKASAISIAVLIHALVFFILTLVVIAYPQPDPPQIRAIAGGGNEVSQDPNKKEVQKKTKPNPAAMNRTNVISVANASAVSVPVVIDPVDTLEPIGLGTDFGMQMSFSAEGAGAVSFFGSQSKAKKVVFVVDASASMSSKVKGSDINKFALMQKELTKSIKQLPPGLDYQVIFFAGPCWFAGDELNPGKEKKEGFIGQIVKAGKEEHFWFEGAYKKNRSPSGAGALYHYENEDNEELPIAEWIGSSKSNIHKTTKHIEETPKIFGTDWRWPLRMAMNMKPDVIYFMTDGAFGLKAEDVVGDLLSYNRKKSRAQINTICLMELKAYDMLQELAEKAKGEFTLVLSDGTTLHGKEIEEWVKDNPDLVEGKKKK